MEPIPLVCHPDYENALKGIIAQLIKKHPRLSKVLYSATSELASYGQDIQEIRRSWNFTDYSPYASTWPPPEVRRIILFRKFFCVPSWRNRRYTLIHEIGHHTIYDENKLPHLYKYSELLEQDLRGYLKSPHSYNPSNPITPILATNPHKTYAILHFVQPLKLPDELGANEFVCKLEPRLFAWWLRKQLQLNIKRFQEIKQIIRSGQQSVYNGCLSVNDIILYKSSLTLGVSDSLRKLANRICKIHEHILHNCLNLQQIDDKDLFTYIDKFISLAIDRKRANEEITKIFEKYVQQFGHILTEIQVKPLQGIFLNLYRS
ncbi:MAG: hypothetical protein ACFFDP_04260 [Promethearchaeota archaeon]